MLQIRIADFNGDNPIILHNAENRIHSKAISSSDEGISFDIAKNDSKAEVINPDLDGYTKRWEVWDTRKNSRLNYGPIDSIEDRGANWRVSGRGRSGLLEDFYQSKKTFYASIPSIIEDLRFENMAIQPRTSTLVHDLELSVDNDTVFGTITIEERYHGLSQRTKDNIIDDDNGQIKVGEIEPPNVFATTTSYWSGMSKKDTIIIDLGEVREVTKLRLAFPWWGGTVKRYNRAYTFVVAYADDVETPITTVQGRDFGPFHTIYSSDSPNREASGPGVYVEIPFGSDISARYFRVRILDVHAWYGNHFDNEFSQDLWPLQCNPKYKDGTYSGAGVPRKGALQGKEISDRDLELSNDCHASIVEAGIYKELVGKDLVKPLALQQIDNNNLQITYSHTADASETVTTTAGLRKFEPGSFFREYQVSYSGANSTYKKFYPTDCKKCYPNGFNFAVMDQNNSMVYHSDVSSGTITDKTGVFTKHLLMKGASNATILWCDAWPATSDALSFGGSYANSEITGDTATIHFRGESFKWYATVPSDKTGATVKIEIRNIDAFDVWTAWSTLEAGLILPSGISAHPVYEISYESGILLPDTTYEIRLTNLSGFISIDSISGYWAGSISHFNEDSTRIITTHPDTIKQIYDSRFSGGSMFKWNKLNGKAFFHFTGDRVVVFSAKGRNHGKLTVYLRTGTAIYDDPDAKVFIPGGDPETGVLTVNLATSKKGTEIPQYVAFDSADRFPNGLPWGTYALWLELDSPDADTYLAPIDEIDSDNFSVRCDSCKTQPAGTVVTQKYVYLDGISAHEQVGLSVNFDNQTHLEILSSVAEATQNEWSITDAGIRVEPRIGVDTNEVLAEGHNTMIDWGIVSDATKIASILISSGSDIDGIPLFAITENKKNKQRLGRTVMRKHDFREIADYFQLIGLSRAELQRRAFPEKRITITHVAEDLDLDEGDSFILFTKKTGSLRVRIERKQIDETSGRVYELECTKWPQIV